MQGNFQHPDSLQATGGLAAFDWRHYWYMLKRRKWLLIIPTIVFGLGAFHFGLSIVPVFESSTTILVSGSKLMTGSVRRLIPGVTAQNEISAVKKYVMSAACIVELIHTLDLKMDDGIREHAVQLSSQLPDMKAEEIATMLFIDKVREDIAVSTTGRDIITLTAAHENPQKAYLLTKMLAQIFMEEFQKRQVSGIRGVREFGEEQLAIYKRKLAESEEKLRKFQEGLLRNQIDDLDLGQQASERIKSDITSAQVSISDKEARLQLLNDRLAAMDLAAVRIDDAGIATNRQELFAKVDELVSVLSQFSWTDPQIIGINNDINDIRDAIRGGVENHVATVYGERGSVANNLLVEHYLSVLDLEILRAERDGLAAKLRTFERSLTQQPSHEMTLRGLKQEVEQNRRMYLNFFQQSQGTQIEEQIQRRDAEFKLQIVEMAKKPLYPINKGFKVIAMLVCMPFVGLALGGGVVIGLDNLDQSVKDVDDIAKELNLPVWGVMPEIRNEEVRFRGAGIVQFLVVILITAVAATLVYLVNKGGLSLLR